MSAGRESQSNDETTGNLHVRQNDYKKAIEAYEKALGQSFISEDGFVFYKRGDLLPANSFSPKNRRLMQRLGQSHIGAGNFDKARQVLDYLSRAEAAASKTREQDSLQFPAQLVVSIKKADLDAIASGKIKSEEFKKRASVRYFDPGEVQPDESANSQRR